MEEPTYVQLKNMTNKEHREWAEKKLLEGIELDAFHYVLMEVLDILLEIAYEKGFYEAQELFDE